MSDLAKGSAWMVDVDGTLALRGGRSPYDWRSVGDDLPNSPVVTTVQALAAHSEISAIIVISGRHEQARQLTLSWLDRHSIPHDELFMRADGDFRPDEVVKQELFEEMVEPYYRVLGVLDDRDRVVKMWRRLGLVCFQVAEGSF